MKSKPCQDFLSLRDKQAIQIVTRYADVLMERQYEFEIRHGRVHFGKPGTTSWARFQEHSGDPQEAERYVAELAAFAFRRLAKKFSHAKRMIHPDVHVSWNDKRYKINLGEIVQEATGSTIHEWVA